MAVLYQKYRPQRFAEVIGQDAIVRALRNASEAGELGHAYLFTGSRGVGKTTIARLIAKAANCLKLKEGDPCGKCDVCSAIAGGTALDVIEIDAASHTGVDNVRELIEHAGFRPTAFKMKVIIIDEVHMLSKAAFNALLKTLEEPPAHVMFILATTDIEKVPDTIVSRTQLFNFKRISDEDLVKALNVIAKDEKLKFPDGVVEAVAEQADGSMRDALSRLDMVASIGSKVTLEDAQRLLGITPLSTVQNLVQLILDREPKSMPDFFEITFAGGSDPSAFNKGILEYLRQILNSKITGVITKGNESNDKRFSQQVEMFTLQQLMFTVRLFLRSYKEISNSPSPDLPLLLAAIEACLHGSADSASAPVPARTLNEQPSVSSIDKTEAVQKTEEVQKTETVQNTQDEVSPMEATPVAVAEKSAGKATDTSLGKATGTSLEKSVETSSGKSVDTSVSMEELLQWWPDVIAKIKVDNSPLSTLLKNSPVIEVKDGKITVAVKYLFHKENLDNKKNSALITQVISEVGGKNLIFRTVIQKTGSQNNADEPILTQTVEALSGALKVFGGELVE